MTSEIRRLMVLVHQRHIERGSGSRAYSRYAFSKETKAMFDTERLAFYDVQVHHSGNELVVGVGTTSDFEGTIGLVSPMSADYVRVAHSEDSTGGKETGKTLETGEVELEAIVDGDGDLEIHVRHDAFDRELLPAEVEESGEGVGLTYKFPVDYGVSLQGLPEESASEIQKSLGEIGRDLDGVDAAGSASCTWIFDSRDKALQYLSESADVLGRSGVLIGDLEVGLSEDVDWERAEELGV